MKIGTFEGVVLTILSVVFDIVNILLAPTLILNTLVNLLFGAIMAMWFMLKNQFVSEEEGEDDSENPYSDIYSERAKYNLMKKRQLETEAKEASAAEEVATETEATEKTAGQEVNKLADQAVEKQGAQTTESTTSKVGEEIANKGEATIASSAEKEGVQAAEKAAAKAGAGAVEREAGEVAVKAGAKAAEGAAVKTGEKITARILGRVLGVTLFSKIVPFINDLVGLLPLWTISTVLLWRQSIKDQQAIKDAASVN